MKKLKLPRYIVWIALTGFIFLLLMSLLRWILVISFRTPSVKDETLVNAYVLGIRYDLRHIGIAMLLMFLLGSIPALHPLNKKWGRRISLWIWGIGITIFCMFYAIDFANYAYLQQRMNASLLNYLDDAKISMSMMWQTYHLGWIILALLGGGAILFTITKLTYNYVLSKPIYATKASRIGWGIGFFLLLALCIFGRVGQYPLRWSDAFALRNDYAANISLNPFQSFFSTLSYRTSTYDEKKVKEHYGWMANFLGVDKPDSSSLNFTRSVVGNDSIAKPNVVLVICESFSMYKSSMVNNPLNTTPFFKQMCEEGIFFDRCFSPSYGTARGVWATLTGIPDVATIKTSSRNPAAVDQHMIINDFTAHDKFYFIGGSTSWANIRGMLTNNIADLHLYEQEDYEAKKQDVWGISDKQLFLESNKVLAKQQKPFFAVIQTADNHRPYTIPKEDQAAFIKKQMATDSLKRFGFSNVDEYNAFRYTDFSYQKFIEAAKKEKYFDNTIFIFVGDHGIAGDAGNMLPKSFTTNALTAMHVPLLFYAPKLLKHQVYNKVCSQVDILPTIAGLCNISYTNSSMGRDILKPTDGKGYIFNFHPDAKKAGFISDSIFYTKMFAGGDKYDVASVVDNKSIEANKSQLQLYQFITDAFFETSRYMILNNKKKVK